MPHPAPSASGAPKLAITALRVPQKPHGDEPARTPMGEPDEHAERSEESGHDEQPSISRSGSSFVFQLNFSRDNPGQVETCYELERHPLGEGTFGSARRA